MSYLASIFGLDGRTAVVTGGSSGIGALAAASLAKAGARVLVCGRRENLLEQATAFAVGAGDRLVPLRIDLSQPDAPMKVAEASEKELGGCDILVCNAGILALSDQPTIDTIALAEHLHFNVTVHAECANAFLPQLRRSECARVINVASIYGLVGPTRSGLAPYVTSKHALVGLTRAQSVQWAEYGITVNAIAPAFFETEMTKPALGNTARREAIQARTPLGRVGSVNELEASILFLASPQNTYMTGAVLSVDGGWTAW